MSEVDVTGLMVKPVEGWEERVEKLCKLEYTWALVGITEELEKLLTQEELVRMELKAKVVEEFARYMYMGMIKGTLKYNSDQYTVEQWMAHLVGEGADQANYQMLLFNTWRGGMDAKVDT